MAEQIDVLMNDGDAAAHFTVNTAVDFVNLTVPDPGLLVRGNEDDEFLRLDHFRLLSIGCVLPLSFEFYDNDNGGVFAPPRIYFYTSLVGAVVPIQTIPFFLWLPFPNYELNLGNYNFLDNAVYTTNFRMYAQFAAVNAQRISMIGVNDDLNEKVFKVPIFLKVLHTLDMTT